MSNTPTELPEDIKKEIEKESEIFAENNGEWIRNVKEYGTHSDLRHGHEAGATAYAPYKVEAERAKKLLERWINVHDLGILPSEQLINEINQFLQSNK